MHDLHLCLFKKRLLFTLQMISCTHPSFSSFIEANRLTGKALHILFLACYESTYTLKRTRH